jgi:hypothetical protein
MPTNNEIISMCRKDIQDWTEAKQSRFFSRTAALPFFEDETQNRYQIVQYEPVLDIPARNSAFKVFSS